MAGWLSCCFRPAPQPPAAAASACPAKEKLGKEDGQSGAGSQLDLSRVGVRTNSDLPRARSQENKREPAWAGRVSSKLRFSLDLAAGSAGGSCATPGSRRHPLAFFGLPESCGEDVRDPTAQAASLPDAGDPLQPPPARAKTDFIQLCGSLEDLVYVGEGSNGVVYSALWHGARVAVKFLLGNGDDSVHLERCITEAILTRVLSHPCVVQCFATAAGQMIPEVCEAIQARCERQHILGSATCQLDRPSSLQPCTGCDGMGPEQAAAMQQFLTANTPGRTSANRGARSASCLSPGAAMDACGDEQTIMELRKVETFFAEEEDVGSSMAEPQPASEGLTIMQTLVNLQAQPGSNCTVVIMEYMDAGTLHQGIMRGDYSARRNIEMRSKLLALIMTAQEVAQGMAHLHGLDILHGDLKPTNVLLKGTPCQYGPCGTPGASSMACVDGRGYTAKIADLGLARPCVGGDTAQLPSDQWGALAYLAPEAAKGTVGKAADVYSFGVMLWEMAAGVRPYLGLTTPQVLMGLVTNTLQLTWPSDGSIYAPLRSLGMACTDPNPVERPSFEMAARILGRMLRHMRTALEPLKQRHSSALSMEMAHPHSGSCTANASPGGNGHHYNHAPRSMPMFPPGTPGGPAGAVCPGVNAALLTQQLGAVSVSRAAVVSGAAAAAAAMRRQQAAGAPLGVGVGSGASSGYSLPRSRLNGVVCASGPSGPGAPSSARPAVVVAAAATAPGAVQQQLQLQQQQHPRPAAAASMRAPSRARMCLEEQQGEAEQVLGAAAGGAQGPGSAGRQQARSLPSHPHVV